MDSMDLTLIPSSRIVEVARLAFETPDVDFLCFGESDQPSPDSALDAAIQALRDGQTSLPRCARPASVARGAVELSEPAAC